MYDIGLDESTDQWVTRLTFQNVTSSHLDLMFSQRIEGILQVRPSFFPNPKGSHWGKLIANPQFQV